MAKTKLQMYKEYLEWKKMGDSFDCIIHIDGGCRGNRIATKAEADSIGAAAFVVVKMPDFEGEDHDQYNSFMYCEGEFHAGLTAGTNNEMEYHALILALKKIKQEAEKYPWIYTFERFEHLVTDEHNPDPEMYNILIHCDSQLIVNQLTNGWAINIPRLKKLNLEAQGISHDLSKLGIRIELLWFDRKYNLADPICNLIMDTGANIKNVNWSRLPALYND